MIKIEKKNGKTMMLKNGEMITLDGKVMMMKDGKMHEKEMEK